MGNFALVPISTDESRWKLKYTDKHMPDVQVVAGLEYSIMDVPYVSGCCKQHDDFKRFGRRVL